jgi:hypothetical protein
MENKPYAWINVNDEYKILFDDELPTAYPEAWMPLYAHPMKEFTDEEIGEIALKTYDGTSFSVSQDKPWHHNIVRFVRAVIKEMQEK